MKAVRRVYEVACFVGWATFTAAGALFAALCENAADAYRDWRDERAKGR